MKRVVLAYSGGLDTSFCIPYLTKERGLEVHTVLADTGGFSAEELDAVSAKALALGAASHQNIDVSQKYYDKCIKYMIFGNMLKNDTYPLSVSSERAFQAMAVVEYAREMGVDYLAHGSTGAGNDQIRFDLFMEILAPGMKVIAPIRELQISRRAEIEYLKKAGFDFPFEKAKYSINQGLWGTSIGGVETLTSYGEIPEEAYPHPVTKSSGETETLEILFEKGVPVALNGEAMEGPSLIRALDALASPYGVGRDVHVGDTIVGLKGRVAFEAAAPLILIKAHHLLEKHVLDKWQLYWKEELSHWYGIALHEAQYLDPVMRNIEAFLDDSQKDVTGKVTIRLRPYHFSMVGCESPYDRMNARFGDYGEGTSAFSGGDVIGFTRIMALPSKIHYALHATDSKSTQE